MIRGKNVMMFVLKKMLMTMTDDSIFFMFLTVL